MSNGNPAAHGAEPLAADAHTTAPTHPPHSLPADLPEIWKKRFALMERAGGLKMTRLKDLGFWERSACTFNVLAGIFGPFYYIAKGMWKKGLAYWCLGIVGIVVLEVLVSLVGYGHLLERVHYTGMWVALFALMANRDYYKKVVLGDNRWL